MITEVIPKSQVNPIPLALLHIEGYQIELNFDPSKENLGRSGIRGVAIYTKSELTVNKIDLNVKGLFEDIWLEIRCGSKTLLVGCVYRSPKSDANTDIALESAIDTSNLLRKAVQHNSNIIISGDFNFKEIDWNYDHTPPGKHHLNHFIDTIHDCFLYQHVTEPTRFRNNERPSLLDLILSRENGDVKELSYLPPLGDSDHLSMRFRMITGTDDVKITQPKSNIFKSNYDAITEELLYYDWDALLNSSFKTDYDKFSEILTKIIDKHTPIIKTKRKSDNIYLTRDALKLRCKKIRLWKRYQASKSNFSLNRYKKCKNRFRALTRKLRKEFEVDLSNNCVTKPKLF